LWDAIAQDSPTAICVVGTDGRWIKPHPRISEWLGYSMAELERMTFQDVTHPDDLNADLANLASLINRESNHYQMEKRYLSESGDVVWVRLTVTALVKGDRVVGFVSQIENISDRKRTDEEIRRLSERLTVALKSAAIGCWEWDIRRNILVWDGRMYELYGLDESSDILPYDAWCNGLHPDDRRAAEILLEQAVSGQAEFDTEFRVIHPNGRIHHIKASGSVLRDDDGTPQRMIGVNFDVSDRKLYEYQLEEMACTDPLTGLRNYRHLENELKRHWNLLQRPERIEEIPFGLIMIDVDNFKSVNDTYGHDTGNCVLKDVANRIVEATRAEDIRFRQHGDEFAVIMPCINDVETAIARLESYLDSSVKCEGNLIHYSCSVGGVVCDRSFKSLKDLYRVADAKMYEKKHLSKRYKPVLSQHQNIGS
jgi:diguanylate cyclase (GGDEF)-like protein/PAS domain S-box-containing protein